MNTIAPARPNTARSNIEGYRYFRIALHRRRLRSMITPPTLMSMPELFLTRAVVRKISLTDRIAADGRCARYDEMVPMQSG